MPQLNDDFIRMRDEHLQDSTLSRLISDGFHLILFQNQVRVELSHCH